MTPLRLRSHRRGRRGLALAGTLVLVGGAASCSATVLPVATLWTAAVESLTPAGVTGTLGVVSQAGETRASMQVNVGESGATYGWRMSEGDCSSEGNLVAGRAAYPKLEIGSGGTASADATLAGELTSGGSYAARIYQDTGAGGELVLACGKMVQTK